MVDCIVCGKPLSDTLRSLNMEYHPEHSKSIIREALKLLDEVKVEDL